MLDCVDVILQYSSCETCTFEHVVQVIGLRLSGIVCLLLSRGAGCCQTRVWLCALSSERSNVRASSFDPDDLDSDCVLNLRVLEDLALFSVLADKHFASTAALDASS